MAMNREQRRLLKKQGELNEQGEPVRQPRGQQQRGPAPRSERIGPKQFVGAVPGELRKVAWPSRTEVANYSVVVLLGIVVPPALIAGPDSLPAAAVLKPRSD